MLTGRNVVRYLLARGVLDIESVVDGDLLVQDVPRRHRNFKVLERRAGTGLFVKQARPVDAHAVASLQREAACYELAQADAKFGGLAALVPRFRHFDRRRSVLVVDLLAGGEDLLAHHRRVASYPPEIGAALGAGLAELHAAVDTKSCADPTLFPRVLPWVLSAATLPADPARPATGELLAIVGRHHEFEQVLRAMRDDWRPTTFIHGDIRWDNWLLQSTGNGDVKLSVVDLELADVGDPAWDVGAVFQAYLTHWVLGAPSSSAGLPVPTDSVERLQPAVRAFWFAYADASAIAPRDRDEWLERCARAAAARMIQSAYEACAVAPAVQPQTVALAQLSMNMLQRPDDAVAQLLGL